ncbi:MAG: N-acetylmuramoyl-L-alanine amidase [Calditrichaeota bacterium]|nr:MAG: N-acetylmuramoyl-L-alanine amidase [Calditrichota bacterium]
MAQMTKSFLLRILAFLQILIFLELSAPEVIFPQNGFNVVYPKHGDVINATDSTFVFGNYPSRDMRVSVNGFNAMLFPNQTFLCMIPVSAGSLRIETQFISDTSSFTDSREIYMPTYLFETSSKFTKIDDSFIYPDRNISIKQGEQIAVIAKGTPGSRMYFSLDGGKMQRMREANHRRRYRWKNTSFGFDTPWSLPRVRGVYVGYFTPNNEDIGKVIQVNYTLIAHDEQVATSINPNSIHVLNDEDVNIKAINQDILLFKKSRGRTLLTSFFEGTLVFDDGGYGEYRRIRFDKNQAFWVNHDNLTTAFENLQMKAVPTSPLYINRSRSDSDHVFIEFISENTIPFQIQHSSNLKNYTVMFWNIATTPGLLRNDYNDPLLSKIAGKMDRDNAYQVRLSFSKKMVWGYEVQKRDRNIVFRFNKAPILDLDSARPLEGMKICIDPGHGPDDGAFGLTGINEKIMTVPYARLLKKMLEERGADIILTRTEETELSLHQRPLFAEANNSDMFISIHFNALPDGVNPIKVRGTSTFYYHPHSRPLAEAVHKRMLKQTGLPDKGFHAKNLAVCRITSMPSILVEPAFIMQPFEETKIIDPVFQEKVCRGIAAGIEDFIKAHR